VTEERFMTFPPVRFAVQVFVWTSSRPILGTEVHQAYDHRGLGHQSDQGRVLKKLFS
jgi:hypothetical protein